MTRSEIMKKAWELYATVSRIAHLAHRKRFSEALKMAWSNAKFSAKITGKEFRIMSAAEAQAEAEKIAAKKAEEQKKAATVRVYTIPNWLMHEKELFGIRSNIVKATDFEKETVKAFRYCGAWFPKSQCEMELVTA